MVGKVEDAQPTVVTFVPLQFLILPRLLGKQQLLDWSAVLHIPYYHTNILLYTRKKVCVAHLRSEK